jgi:hypothetical protein
MASQNYTPSANTSIDFNCQYNPPIGLVSVNFPDTPCPDLGVIGFNEGAVVVFDLSFDNSIDANSGEASSVELNTYAILGNFSSQDGQTQFIDNLAISASFVLSANDGSSIDVSISTPPSAYIDANFISGENNYVDLLKSTLVSPNIEGGEELDVDVSANPSVDLGRVTPFSGEIYNTDVYTYALLYSNILSGESASFDLDVGEPDVISSSIFAGECQYSEILTDPKLNLDELGGETLSTDLAIFPPVDLTIVSARSGETFNSIDLVTYRILSFNNFAGENVSFDITYIQNSGSPSDNFSGETLSASLDTSDALPFISYSGELGSSDLSTSYLLEFNAYSENSISLDIQLFAPVRFDANGYSGEVGSIPFVNYTTNLGEFAYGGEVYYGDLTTYPAAALLFAANSGDNTSAAIQTSEQIGRFDSQDGQSIVIEQIDSLENYRFPSGENLLATLKTEIVFELNYPSGEGQFSSLETRPSEGIGRLQPSAGEAATVDALKTIQHHNLYVVFWNDTRVQVDIDSQTYFDLTVDSCCGGPRALKAQEFRIEMDFAEYPDQVHFGDHTVFHVELSCRPRFHIDFIGGENFKTFDNVVYIAQDDYGNPQMYFRNAESFALVSFESQFIHRLCKGFFIPNGNNIQVELTDVLDESCYVDRIYTGEKLSAVLCNTCNVSHINHSGEYANADLAVIKPWELEAWGGEHFEIGSLSTTVKLGDLTPADGSDVYIKFHEPDWIGAGGETAIVSLDLDVQVEFVDDGCLENEYIYMNEDGDPIPEKFTPVPIELYPYQHDIKARCF